jgi:MFS family permease
MDSKGYSPILTGNILMLLAVGTIIGAPIAGRLSDRTFHSRKSVALCGLSLYGVSIFPLTGVLNIQSPLLYAVIFFFMGFFHGFGNLIYSHAKEVFPADISGTVMAWVNFFTVAGAAIFTPFLGKVIATFPSVDHSYPAEAYHLSFLICFLGMVASLIFYFFSEKERYI